MRTVHTQKRLSEVCQIKPPKKEAKVKLDENELVSFVPMDQLGICTKTVGSSISRPMAEVYSGYTYFGENDVLLAKITPCFENGKLGIARNLTNGVGFGSSEYIVFRCVPDLDPEYLFFYLSQKSFREIGAKNMAGAVGHKRVTKEFIENSEIPLPPLSEQKRIVAILDEAFEGIDAAIANTQKNLSNARELFQSFLNSVFRNGGRGWTDSTLGDVCIFQGGSQPPKSEFSPVLRKGYIRLIQIRDYKSDKHIVYIPKEKARRFCSADDVMIGRYGPPLFQILRGIEGAYNVALMKALPKDGKITKDFLFYFLKNGDILQYIISASNRAAGQIGLNKATLEPYKISFPEVDEQKKLVQTFDRLYEESKRLETLYQQKLNSLNELKQSLLAKAFSGELTADSEPVLKEAVG